MTGGTALSHAQNGASPKSKRAVPRLALRRSEAAEAIGVSLDFFEQHVQPEIAVVHVGRLLLVPTPELEAWLRRNARELPA